MRDKIDVKSLSYSIEWLSKKIIRTYLKNMQVWVFGNTDLKGDSVPLKLLPELKKRFPALDFVVKDPNENWDMPEKLVIIDTITGIKEVAVFTSLDDFVRTPRITMHDFDLGMKLKWLAKLKKLPPFVIIGVPAEAAEDSLDAICSSLQRLIRQ